MASEWAIGCLSLCWVEGGQDMQASSSRTELLCHLSTQSSVCASWGLGPHSGTDHQQCSLQLPPPHPATGCWPWSKLALRLAMTLTPRHSHFSWCPISYCIYKGAVVLFSFRTFSLETLVRFFPLLAERVLISGWAATPCLVTSL